MKVIYKNPNDIKYKRWFDDNGVFDIWYESETAILNCKKVDIPTELKAFLNEWSDKIKQYKTSFIEQCPVKLAHIEFIYNEVVYVIYPETISATYTTTFLKNEEYEVSWDALFEAYQREIRNDLKKKLKVEHSRYFGMLD